MRNILSVIRLALLGLCFILTACTTKTQQSAIIARISPDPAPVFNFQVVNSGGSDGADAVYRSGQPKNGDWDYLEKIGIKTVIKLNEFSDIESAAEEIKLANDHHINVIQMYMQPEDFPHNLDLSAHPDENLLRQAVEALESSKRPVLVHCSHGKDRTGLVVAVYSVRNKNYCKEAALKEMDYYGTSSSLSGLKPMLDSPDIIESPGCTNEWIAK
jgi:protein tyrosine phosphatase (PTP) superfamily phosphohydrolase (DUF442 family)